MNQKSLRWISVSLAAALLLSIGSPTVFAMQEAAPVNTAETSTVSTSSAVTDTQPEATAAVDGNIEINSTTFPDKYFRDWVKDHIAGAGDGVLTPEERAAVTKIDVSGWNIEDLTGIEYFPNLKSLTCRNTDLKSLDVSANTALEYLNCSENKFTSLDVSNNTALKKVDCEYGRLISLDVSGATALEYLYCNNNQLTSLDVSGDTALKEVYCYENQLKSLDLSGNTALEYLNCNNNNLKSLDVSGNTALKELRCSHNNLTSLDLSGDTVLETLYCNSNQLTSLDLSGDTVLETLYCNSNQLTSLDLSGDTALAYLGCTDNNLTSLDLSGDTALKELYCYQNQLTSLDLSGYTALKYLYCYNNQLTSLDLSGDTALKELYCYQNQLTSLDVSGDTALEYLNCENNKLTCLDLSENLVLYTLKCNGNNLAYLNLPYSNSTRNVTYSSYSVVKCYVSSSSLDLNEAFPGIQIDMINNLQGATLNDGILTDWTNGSPITYIYDCGLCNVINVTLQIYMDNSWTMPLSTSDIVYGEPVQPQAVPAFGEVQYLYSDTQDGTYQEEAPVNVGTYWVKAIVEEMEGYAGLESEPVSFQILPKSCNQLTIPTIDENTDLDALVILDGDKQLVQGQDYNIATQSIGFNATTTITFKGNYTGVVTQEYPLSSIKVNEVNFPDEHFRNWIMHHVAGADDGVLTLTECENVTEIDVASQHIEDLTGIENFTNLKRLSCANNQLTGLSLSSNTALQSLDCGDNQLEKLDMSGNPALKDLDCRYNQLTSLDISSNTELYEFNCYANDLTNLDLSGNAKLRLFSCGRNCLTGLDLSGNLSLECFDCSSNPLAYLNLPADQSTGVNMRSLQTVNLESSSASLNLSETFPGIQLDKISNLEGATLKDGELVDWSYNSTITYDYDCGQGKTLPVTLTISSAIL